jgi:hypothetical protein
MCNCFSQKAFRLFLIAGREGLGACMKEFWMEMMRGNYRERFAITITIPL